MCARAYFLKRVKDYKDVSICSGEELAPTPIWDGYYWFVLKHNVYFMTFAVCLMFTNLRKTGAFNYSYYTSRVMQIKCLNKFNLQLVRKFPENNVTN